MQHRSSGIDSMSSSQRPLLWLGLALRSALLLVGQWQDAHLQVKYTDIDYEVVTDAAAFMAQGQSPFERSTYRYTPLLAGALLPNVTLHKAWGKLIDQGVSIVQTDHPAVLLDYLASRGLRGPASIAVADAGSPPPASPAVSSRSR